MKSLILRHLSRDVLVFTLVGSLCSGVWAQSTPAQSPLLTKSGNGVSPNIMLTLDDSGSMTWRHMPEDKFAADTYTVTNPVGSNGMGFDKRDTYMTNVNWKGSVPGIYSSTNYVLLALRSPDTNSLYYNPETKYLPWANADGISRMANSNPLAAPIDPMNAGGTTINLTATLAVSASTSGWCFANAANTSGVGTGAGQGCELPAAAFTHDPGVYFRLQKQTNTVSAGSFVVGKTYTIASLGTTNFKSIGAASNIIGLTFTALGAGTGTGTATQIVYKSVTSASNYDRLSINSASGSYTKYTNRTDCAGSSCTQAEERQNFANWFTYYRTRNLMARGALMESFWKAGNSYRVGWGRINKGSTSIDGVSTSVIEAGVRDFNQTTKNALYSWLQALPANGGTPLPSALDTVGQYYMRTDARGPYTDDPSQSSNTVSSNKTCRRSYTILTTDGYWTSQPTRAGNSDATNASVAITGNGRTYQYVATTPYKDTASNTLADYAMYYWKQDLQPSMANNVAPIGDDPSFWQNMTTFTLGLGVRGTLDPALDLPALVAGTKAWPAACTTCTAANVDDLWHAAVNSRGKYFSAKNPTELATAVKNSLDTAAGGTGTTAGVATASTVLEATNRKYIPTYTAGEWSGDVGARALDANGQVTATVWSAASVWPVNATASGGLVTDWSRRNIKTWDVGVGATPTAIPFDWASMSPDSTAALGSMGSNYGADFVNFIRGDHSKEGVGNPFRTRVTGSGATFVLGDFVNSNPVFVLKSVDNDYSRIPSAGASYQAFLNSKAQRIGTLFVGGNDGMLHAFADSKGTYPSLDGQEVFAYVPRAVYGNLGDLADKTYGSATVPHRYFVDGWQKESDVYVRAPGAAVASWRNYLIGSLGAGGRAIYAMDVTNTVTSGGVVQLNSNTPRWELTDASITGGDADLGYVFSPIETGVLPNGHWVAIFGNGSMSSSGKAVLFVVDIDSAQSGLAGAITKIVVDASGPNGLGGVALHRNSTGYIDRVYAGDLKGNIWRFDYNSSSASLQIWQDAGTDKPIFSATDNTSTLQPITQAPLLFTHPQGGVLLVVGTGKLATQTDASSVARQTLYGIWDKDPDTVVLRTMTRAALESRSISQLTGTTTGTYYSIIGGSVDWTTKRGWYVDFQVSPLDIPGLRVIYPLQAIDSKLALVSVVAPAQSAVVCQNNTGVGIDFIVDVQSGGNPSFNLFDTNGDNVVNGSDQIASGWATGADGVDSIVVSSAKTSTSNTADGQCAAGYYRVSIQNSSGQMMTCAKKDPPPAGSALTLKDRVQRRILVPPIR